jgi:hypothetical protein
VKKEHAICCFAAIKATTKSARFFLFTRGLIPFPAEQHKFCALIYRALLIFSHSLSAIWAHIFHLIFRIAIKVLTHLIGVEQEFTFW